MRVGKTGCRFPPYICQLVNRGVGPEALELPYESDDNAIVERPTLSIKKLLLCCPQTMHVSRPLRVIHAL